jgi:hypothetical protein
MLDDAISFLISSRSSQRPGWWCAVCGGIELKSLWPPAPVAGFPGVGGLSVGRHS